MGKVTAKEVIKTAKKYVGYLEKESNKQLDSMKVNAGDENYTRFAREYEKLTGVNYQGQAWCDMYIDVIFAETFGKDKAKELLGGFSAYTPTSANYFKKMNRWHTSNPKVGDIIFFENSARINHTGIVAKVTNSTVYTIEGNTSSGKDIIPNGGAVCEKSYALNNPRIAGYGRPDYEVDFILTKPSTDWVKRLQSTLNKLGYKDFNGKELVVDGIVGSKTKSACKALKIKTKNELVTLVQERLNELGFDCGKVDGDFGSKTANGVIEMKKVVMGAKNPTSVIGTKSWDVLLGTYKM